MNYTLSVVFIRISFETFAATNFDFASTTNPDVSLTKQIERVTTLG
jgi:hypothetical protein